MMIRCLYMAPFFWLTIEGKVQYSRVMNKIVAEELDKIDAPKLHQL